MVFIRFGIGALILGLAIWVIIGEQITGASANATINARLVTLRSPVAGVLDEARHSIGEAVDRGKALAHVSDPRVDDVRFDDLNMEMALEVARADQLSTQITEDQSALVRLEERSESFRQSRVKELEARLAYAKERLELLNSGRLPLSFDIRPPESAGVETAGAPRAVGLRVLWINAVMEEIAVLEVALAAAKTGVFLGDGYNDAPNAEQRAEAIRTELVENGILLSESKSRLEAYRQRIAEEKKRIDLAEGADLLSPVTGRYWEVLAAPREYLERGDPVARLLDCETMIVTLSVTESVYNTLAVGDAAVFRPVGSSQRLEGEILRLAGSGAGTIYRNLAVAPSQQHLERFDVAIDVPELHDDPELACAIGRTGRVFFERRPLDWLRSLW